MIRRHWSTLIGLLVFCTGPAAARADQIYILGNPIDPNPGNQVVADLTALGHTVTFGGLTTLSDYTAYDQVWDLRYYIDMGAADVTAMGAFLAQGGRMYLSGESEGFFSRNFTLRTAFLPGVGAGTITGSGPTFTGDQEFTVLGNARVNTPTHFANISYGVAGTYWNVTDGFKVTQTTTGYSSLFAWDFDDISGAPDARMMVGFDMEMFLNPIEWTEDIYTYLASPVPAPGAGVLGLIGLGLVAWIKRRIA